MILSDFVASSEYMNFAFADVKFDLKRRNIVLLKILEEFLWEKVDDSTILQKNK